MNQYALVSLLIFSFLDCPFFAPFLPSYPCLYPPSLTNERLGQDHSSPAVLLGAGRRPGQDLQHRRGATPAHLGHVGGRAGSGRARGPHRRHGKLL